MIVKEKIKRALGATVFSPVDIGDYIKRLYFARSIKTISLGSFKNILDAGCGNGSYAIKLARKYPFAKIKAGDIKEDFPNANLKNLTFERIDLSSLEDRAQYDFIYAIDVLEHIPHNIKVIEKLHEALKPNGYFFLHMPGKFEKWILPDKLFSNFKTKLQKEHIGEHYSLEELREILIKMNFQIIQAHYTFGFFGKFSQEIDILLSRNFFFKIFRLSLMPFLKFMGIIEVIVANKTGCNFLIICKK